MKEKATSSTFDQNSIELRRDLVFQRKVKDLIAKADIPVLHVDRQIAENEIVDAAKRYIVDTSIDHITVVPDSAIHCSTECGELRVELRYTVTFVVPIDGEADALFNEWTHRILSPPRNRLYKRSLWDIIVGAPKKVFSEYREVKFDTDTMRGVFPTCRSVCRYSNKTTLVNWELSYDVRGKTYSTGRSRVKEI